MGQVPLQRPATAVGEAVLGTRYTSDERLPANQVAPVFQLAGVGAEVAVRSLQQILQFLEGETFRHREGAHDPQSDPTVDQLIQLRGAGQEVSTPLSRHRTGGLGGPWRSVAGGAWRGPGDA